MLETKQTESAYSEVIGPISGSLFRWLAAGRPFPMRSRWRYLWYRWQSWLFDFNLGLTRKAAPAQAPGPDPLLVLGAWRSGTTWLHELLASHAGFHTPLTWQCMAPSTSGLTGAPTSTKSVKRPMDDFTVDAFSPQEDEFALMMLGGNSVYRALLDPGRIGSMASILNDPSDHALGEQRYEDDWLSFLGRLKPAGAQVSTRLLLKSPNHSFRLATMARIFPALQGVWITRDPEDLLDSNLRLWSVLCAQYGLKPLDAAHLDRWMDEILHATAIALDGWCAAYPRERLVVLSLSELKRDPLRCTLAIFDRLGMQADEAVVDAVRASIARRASVKSARERQASGGDTGGGRGTVLSPSRAALLQRLAQSQDAAHASHGLDLV